MWNTPTEKQLAHIPPIGSQLENPKLETGDITIHLHFFMGACDWYIAEYDGKDSFYGYANLGDSEMAEWGYISFRELRALRANVPVTMNGKSAGYLAVEVDCDNYWEPKKFSEIKRK